MSSNPAAYDIGKVRSHFPALKEGAAHFDGPGGTQTPDVVAHAVADTLMAAVANRGVVTAAERRAEEVVAACRTALGDLLGSDPGGIIVGRSATQITYDLSRALAKQWGPGDDVVVSRLDHDSNVRPWVQAAEAVGATVRWAGFDPETGEQTTADFEAVIGDRTRLVAMTAASNLIGTRPPLCSVGRKVHAVGGLLWVDGVHATAHKSVDREALGADFWSFRHGFLGFAEWIAHGTSSVPFRQGRPLRREDGTDRQDQGAAKDNSAGRHGSGRAQKLFTNGSSALSSWSPRRFLATMIPFGSIRKFMGIELTP